jgi:transposase, IS6 family
VSIPSGFVGFCFPPESILLAVRWYLQYGLSHGDLEELLAERGIEVDHVTLYRWVHRFTPLLIEGSRIAGSSTRPTSKSLGSGPTCTGRTDRDTADDVLAALGGPAPTAVDQHGQVIDEYWSRRREIDLRVRSSPPAAAVRGDPGGEVITDRRQRWPT